MARLFIFSLTLLSCSVPIASSSRVPAGTPSGCRTEERAGLRIAEARAPSRVLRQSAQVQAAGDCYKACCDTQGCNAASYYKHGRDVICTLLQCEPFQHCVWKPSPHGHVARVEHTAKNVTQPKVTEPKKGIIQTALTTKSPNDVKHAPKGNTNPANMAHHAAKRPQLVNSTPAPHQNQQTPSKDPHATNHHDNKLAESAESRGFLDSLREYFDWSDDTPSPQTTSNPPHADAASKSNGKAHGVHGGADDRLNHWAIAHEETAKKSPSTTTHPPNSVNEKSRWRLFKEKFWGVDSDDDDDDEMRNDMAHLSSNWDELANGKLKDLDDSSLDKDHKDGKKHSGDKSHVVAGHQKDGKHHDDHSHHSDDKKHGGDKHKAESANHGNGKNNVKGVNLPLGNGKHLEKGGSLTANHLDQKGMHHDQKVRLNASNLAHKPPQPANKPGNPQKNDPQSKQISAGKPPATKPITKSSDQVAPPNAAATTARPASPPPAAAAPPHHHRHHHHSHAPVPHSGGHQNFIKDSVSLLIIGVCSALVLALLVLLAVCRTAWAGEGGKPRYRPLRASDMVD